MSAFFQNPARPILSVDDSAALRSEPSTHLTSASLAIFLGAGANFLKLARFKPDSTDSDDDSTTWKPSNLAGGDPGRWKVLGGETGAHTYVKRKSDGTIDGASGSSPDFSDHVLHVNAGGATPSTGLYGLSVNITLGANRRGVFYDPANSTFAIAEDTLGDDTTIASYYPLRASAMRASSFENSAGGTASSGLIRLASGDEMKARISATTYRMIAALSGPVIAVGDSAATSLTLDASGTIKMTVASGNFDLRGGAYTWKSADALTTLLDASVSSATFKIYAHLTTYDGSGVAVFDADGTTGTTAITGIATVTKSSIGTTKTRAFTVVNETTGSTQVSGQLGFSTNHSGGTQHNFGWQLEPQSSSRMKMIGYYGTGSTVPASSIFTIDSSDPNYGLACSVPTFIATLNGYRLLANGGGVKENGSGRALFQSAASGEPWEALASTSTSNTGARFQLTADAGTPTNGYLLRVGYGSGSFATSKFDLYYDGRIGMPTVDPAVAGQLGMASTGRLRMYATSSDATAAARSIALQDEVRWTHVATDVDVTAAVGQLIEVDTSANVEITLPAIPSGVSERTEDVIVVDAKGSAATHEIRVVPAGLNTINGTSVLLINTNFGSVVLKHNGQTSAGGADGKWFVL